MEKEVITMNEEIHLIAERIRELREISGISTDALAQELGVSQDVILEYESGAVDIPVGFLYKVAHKFGIELAAILTGENPRLHVYCVVRKDNGLQWKEENSISTKVLHLTLSTKKQNLLLSKLNRIPKLCRWNLIRIQGRSLIMLLRER